MASQDSQSFRWHYIEFDDRNFQIGGRTFFFAVALFAIVLLVTLLFLYVRWARRCNHLHFAAHLPRAQPPQPRGLDPSTINSFSIVLHSSSATRIDESECCICLGVFTDGEKVKVLPNCHHCYHSECVDKWLSSQPSCPLCRSSLLADSVV